MRATRIFKSNNKNELKLHSVVNMKNDEQNVEVAQKSPLWLSVDREVARSVFFQLSGAIANLMYDERDKSTPSEAKLDFYMLARKALSTRNYNFRLFSTNDIDDVFKTLSPILKQLSKSKSKMENETIFETHKQIFIDLIKATGVV